MADSAVLSLGIVGDYDTTSLRHAATYAGLQHAGERFGLALRIKWLPTDAIAGGAALAGLSGVFITTGSPYRSLEGVLSAIEHARVRGIPLLGTCGGFQHVVHEHARNVLGLSDIHADDSETGNPLITKLACSLVDETMEVSLREGSRVQRIYGSMIARETYYCSYGLRRDREAELERSGLRISGRDPDSEPRVVERDDHPFFVASLFVPQIQSRPERPHPLLIAFVEAARAILRAERK